MHYLWIGNQDVSKQMHFKSEDIKLLAMIVEDNRNDCKTYVISSILDIDDDAKESDYILIVP